MHHSVPLPLPFKVLGVKTAKMHTMHYAGRGCPETETNCQSSPNRTVAFCRYLFFFFFLAISIDYNTTPAKAQSKLAGYNACERNDKGYKL